MLQKLSATIAISAVKLRINMSPFESNSIDVQMHQYVKEVELAVERSSHMRDGTPSSTTSNTDELFARCLVIVEESIEGLGLDMPSDDDGALYERLKAYIETVATTINTLNTQSEKTAPYMNGTISKLSLEWVEDPVMAIDMRVDSFTNCIEGLLRETQGSSQRFADIEQSIMNALSRMEESPPSTTTHSTLEEKLQAYVNL
jgi:hypothetical protein